MEIINLNIEAAAEDLGRAIATGEAELQLEAFNGWGNELYKNLPAEKADEIIGRLAQNLNSDAKKVIVWLAREIQYGTEGLGNGQA